MEDLYRIYFDISQVIFLVLDERGRIVDLNRKACEILGVSKDEAVGLDWFENFIPSEIRDTIREVHSKIMRGEMEGVEEFENEILTKAGRRLIRWRNAYMTDENGRIKMTVSSGMDITDERKSKLELERYVRFYEFLIDLTTIVLREGWSDGTLKRILKIAVEKFPKAQAGSVVLKRGKFYRFVALEGYDFEKLKEVIFDPEKVREFAFTPQVVKWKDRMVVHDVDERTKRLLREYGRVDDMKATLVLPITYRRDIKGYITLDNFDSEDAFDETDLKFARIFQNHVQILFEKHELERKLSYMADHDPLTGALNMRSFLERLKKAVERSKRNGESFGIVYFDLDGFKDINDTYGHECGDFVLKRVVEELSKIFRISDEIGRMGGDEFAILLYDVDEKGLISFVDRFEKFFENFRIDWNGFKLSVDASAGYSIYPEDGEDPSTLLKVADRRMYAKKRGKVT